jgi:plastocyanin
MKKAAALLILVLASVALVACGSSSDSSSNTGAETTAESGQSGGGGEASGGGTLEIAAADSGLAFASDTASSAAGKVTLAFENPQPIAHDVAIEDDSGKTIGETEIVTAGNDSTTVDLKPGTYHFYCTVPGHREAGMEGTLTVK